MTERIDLLKLSPQAVVEYLKGEGINRFYFVNDKEKKRVIPSHEVLEPIATFIQNDKRDFMDHEGLFFQISDPYDTLQGAFVHRTNRGQAAGGVRYWSYDTFEEYLRDGLRLAKGMTRKNALAGLHWGGGKGVMAHNPAVDKGDGTIRESLYQSYGKLMSSINGCYVTAEDVGTHVTDMANVACQTRFTTCIPSELGGSGNPSVPTARGVISGMEGAIQYLNLGTLEGKVVVVQGMGNVGEPLIGFLFEKGVKKVIASDINPDLKKRLGEKFSGKAFETVLTKRGDNAILGTPCDIVAPCATGAVLNPDTISAIKARIVCGAANNQLEDAKRDDGLLFEKGICYVPDFLTNRMGIVNCANEQYGYVNEDPMIEKHLSREWEYSIYQMTLKVLNTSKQEGKPPAEIAMRIADELSLENHPIFGHRGILVIRSLVENRWHEAD